MVARKLTLVSSDDSESLVVKYNQLIARAEKAYFFGLQEKASNTYKQAFDLSIQLLCSPNANTVSVRRVAEVSSYRFDHCPVFDDSEEEFYLEVAANALEDLVRADRDLATRKAALQAYKSVACLACELVRFNQSMRCQLLIDQYVQIEMTHSKFLAN
ncbi:hypothetical protein A7985_01815 [Pseudoalteromonas luteoviolacea]|uniref:Uncharacterized protein n=1 Tax=Pseudoalteromonas luteoviolacea TaxID=43657 RepID=A0A1C0TTS2_9GAMM|nr:hypothetical protein [Pseudoalteromonas luteoviolacea]MBQ4811241.1 hypothetical protein [Pseudoalteromonas luteoviolacea]OCQ22719.1 hypothetical protein A7985_01815 [Pseudoalteromonas luteoviolacea]